MSEGAAGAGIGIRHGMEHRDCKKCLAHNHDLWQKDASGQPIPPPEGTPCTGDLIYAEWTRPNEMANQYDEWRSMWCNKYRTANTPEGFREGTINLETLEFSLKNGFRPEWSKEQIVAILNSEVY